MKYVMTMAAAALIACAPASSGEVQLARQLETLAGTGHAEANYHLGMLYNNGLGVAQDPKRALRLFEKAAAGGDPLGAYKLGCYYAGQFGDVIKRDETLALKHKLVAAKAGYALAQIDVAIMYHERSDMPEALRWFEAAARQGQPQALYNLSVMYKDGIGTAPSPPRAWAFFRLAHLASRGEISPGAKKSLDEMWAKLNPSERAEAERIDESWITGPSALTRQALSGQERAEALVAAGAK
jgi:TPR repeat protein